MSTPDPQHRGRTVLTVAAVIVVAVGALSSCSDPPASRASSTSRPVVMMNDTIAIVDGEPISLSEEEHWYQAMTNSFNGVLLGAFTHQQFEDECRKHDRSSGTAGSTDPPPATPAPSPSDFCGRMSTPVGRTPERLRFDAARWLIQDRWLVGEAKVAGITLSDDAVERTIRDYRGRVGDAYAMHQQSTGMTDDDVRRVIRHNLLQAELEKRLNVGGPPSTPAPPPAYRGVGPRPSSMVDPATPRPPSTGRKNTITPQTVQDFDQRWRAKTVCGAAYYVESLCGSKG